ncbi:anoctamin-1 isoform X3 [Condylostylus longicornis]|uniref:anoctamin-1 isoform X3 n=1 Tax=Condylostylus longicornis TaxID=2530218 RepID=UPI00244E51CD|nr:anoctamin-1 isoform X3 [Condylostylus longicornis]
MKPEEGNQNSISANIGVYTGDIEENLMKSLRERRNKMYGYKSSENNFQLSLNSGHNELSAISMVSLCDRDVNEMDTDRNDTISTREMTPITYSSPGDTCVNETNIEDDTNNNMDTLEPPNEKLNHSEILQNHVYNFTRKIFTHSRRTSRDPSPNPFEGFTTLNSSLYMSDGIRSVDFVLAWECNVNNDIEKINFDKRLVFEQNLVGIGLEIEREIVGEDLNFVKIHAPLDVLRQYAEILKLRLPMKEIPGLSGIRTTTNNIYSQLKGFGASLLKKILVDERHFPRKSHRFTAIYSRDKEYLFDLQQDNFFSAAVRSRIVQFILDRQRYVQSGDDFAFGIERLVSEGVYIAAYPLHDGEISVPGSMRYILYTEWAAVRKWYRYQPLDYVKEYFGVKIGLYFAWLGYYTYMLLLASVVGVICFSYSFLTLDKNIPTNQICSGKPEIKMCPLCDYWCDYWSLKETCFYARITYLIDNSTTVFFAVFMSFWATLFLELWKRYSAEITHRWDLTGFDVHEEHPRPQYLARLAHVRKTRIDYVTNTKEPQPPFWRMKVPATILSFSVVLLLVALAFAAVLAVVLYRISILAALSVYGSAVNTSSAIMITTGSAACINLCLIFVFNYMYTYLAQYLTELELLRTQTEFDDSLTLKIYLLQFVNYYASIFYIAFFKGKFVGHPGKYNRWLEYRQEECSNGGCLTELCIQLAIIMIGKQAMNSILEMIMPIFWKWVNIWRVGWLNRNRNKSKKMKKGTGDRWLRDLKLVEWGPRSLFPEYLEMVLQYGFVTIFVTAFPLAPLFALLNNILEMRLDAKKLLTYYRRPVSQRVKDIGVWYRILDSIGKLSVITNGFIIAFTSDFIPRLVYLYRKTEDKSLEGYLNYTLAYFDTNDFEIKRNPASLQSNITVCRYNDFRAPPNSPDKYDLTNEYYIILACRLGFVVLFENFVALVMILVRWCIPDMSTDLRDQIRREAYITNEIIIKQETLRARAERAIEQNVENDPNLSFIKMEKLMSGKLSQSELDLMMHGSPEEPTAPGHKPAYPPPNTSTMSSGNVNMAALTYANPTIVDIASSDITMDTADTGPVSV